MGDIGSRDIEHQLLCAAAPAVALIHKAHKWFITRADLNYAALWILCAATPLAQIEIIGRGRLADREVIPRALELNPAFFKIIYVDMLNAEKTAPAVKAALRARAALARAGVQGRPFQLQRERRPL